MKIDYQKNIKSFIDKSIEEFEFYPEKYCINFHKITNQQHKKDLDRLIQQYTSNIKFNPTEASVYYNRGLLYSKKQSYKQALEDFTKAIELNKYFISAYISRGETYFLLKQNELSESDFNKAIELTKDNPNPTIYITLGNIRRKDFKFKESIEYFNKAIELNSSIELAFYGRAMAYRGLLDYQNALKDFTKAIELNPSDSYAFCNRGITYTNMECLDDALKDFDSALNLNSDDVFVLNNKGIAHRKKLEEDSAEKCFKSAIEKMPEDSYAYYNLGNLNREQGLDEKALKFYSQAIDLDYSFIPAYIAKANLLVLKNDLKQAKEDVCQTIEFMPTNSICHTMLGYINILLEDYKSAVENFKLSIKYDRYNNSELIYCCGLSYFYLKDYLTAEKYFTNAIENSCDTIEIVYAKSICLFEMKEYDKCIESFSGVIDNDGSIIEAYLKRGISYTSIGNYEQAYSDFDEVISKNYSLGECYFYKGICNLKLSKYKDALDCFNLAISNEYNDKISVLKNRALILNELKQYKKALDDCNEVLKADDSSIETIFCRAKVYVNLKMYDEAEIDIAKVLELMPENKEATMLNLKIKFLQNKYEEVVDTSNNFLNDNSFDFDFLNLRAQAYMMLDLPQKACADYTQIILNTEDNIEYYVKRIGIYISIKSYEEALEDIDYVLSNDENNILAYFYKGIIYRNKGEIIDALKNYDIALKLMSKNDIVDIDLNILETKRYFYSEKKKVKEIKEKKTSTKTKTTAKETKVKAKVSKKKENIEIQIHDDKVESIAKPIVEPVVEPIVEPVAEPVAEQSITNNVVNDIIIEQDLKGTNTEIEKHLDEETQNSINIEPQNNVNIDKIDNPIKENVVEPIESSAIDTIEQLNVAIEKDKTNAEYYKKRANLYFEQLDFENAIKDYDMVIRYSKDKDINVFINKYKSCLELKKYDAAIEAISEAIKLDSANADLYYERALLYQQKGDDVSYLKNINLTLDYEPEYEKAYVSRAYYYVEISRFNEAYRDAMAIGNFAKDIDNRYLLAIITFNLKKYSETISLLIDIYDIKQNEKNIDYYLGISFAKMQNYDSAIKYLTKTLNKGIKDEEVYYLLAKSYFVQQEFKNSLDCINKIIISEDYKIYWLKADIYLKLNNMELALQNFDRATKINSKDKDLIVAKINVLEKLNRDKDIIDAYSNLISLYKDDGNFYYKRGLKYQKIGKNIEAQKDFSMAKSFGIEINDSLVNQHKQESVVLQQPLKPNVVVEKKQVVENKETAKQEFEESQIETPKMNENNAKIDPKSSMIYLNRGNSNFQKHKYKEAIEDLTKAIQFNPKDIQCYLLRAEIYFEINDQQAAIQDFLKVLAISPKAIYAYIKLGNIYREQANFDKSEYYYKKAIEINSRNANAYYGYARLCEDNGQKDLAINNYQMAAKLDIKLAKECNMKILELRK